MLLCLILTAFAIASCGGGGGAGSDPASSNNTATYSISGTITSSGTGTAGVTVTLSGASTATATTDVSGNYTFNGLANGSYTVTPSKTGYTFSPTSTAKTVNGSNMTNVNFTATTTTTFATADLEGTWVGTLSTLGTTSYSYTFDQYGTLLSTTQPNVKVFNSSGVAGNTYGGFTITLSPSTGTDVYLLAGTMDSTKTTMSGWFAYGSNNNAGTWSWTRQNVVSNSTWSITGIESAASKVAMALDTNNKTHMVYRDASGRIIHETNSSGAWTKETVNNSLYVDDVDGEDSMSIAVDSQNKIHIAYGGGLSSDLNYITNISGSWITTVIDQHLAGTQGSSPAGNGVGNSIKVDSSNKVYISYTFNSQLKYASNASGSWVTTALTPTNCLGNTSLGIDSNNNLHICYAAYGPWSIKCTTNATGNWVTDNIGNADRNQVSLAIDSNNKVHVGYFNAGLVYANNTSGSWVTTVVDADAVGANNSFVYSAMAVDLNNSIFIAYSSYRSANLVGNTYYPIYSLKYASNNSGGWVSEIIDQQGNVSGSLAIVINGSGKASIGYTTSGLNYAYQY